MRVKIMGTKKELPTAAFLFGLEIGPEDTVVDVGCGFGEACVAAGERGVEVIGIDIEPELIDRVRKRMLSVPARSFRGVVNDAHVLPLADATASVVICTEVLEHVDDPSAVLAELVRIGRPGAQYLITVPDPASESVMRAVAPSWYFQKPIHQTVFEHEHLDSIVRASGLTIECRTGCGFKESMWWFCRMAIGMNDKYEPAPPAQLLKDWNRVAAELDALPSGRPLLRELDRILPKSQVLIARKPDVPARDRFSVVRRSRWKHWLRDGRAMVLGLDLRWSVRRAS
jgi:2-polyprenyl-3-methyl-5-hydroxy-6-metoxy-1,4-benzoquinol methylase